MGQWQTSGEFTGLTEGTEYEIVTRVSGSGLALASEPSIPVTFKAENVFEEIGTASELLAFAKKIGYPVIVRPAYTLGGTGGGIAEDPEQLETILSQGLHLSRVGQVLLEKSIKG